MSSLIKEVPREANIASTGVSGLDDILNGGLKAGHTFLLEGNPGTGKTTIALRFLMEGARAGEPGLYITMSETEDELRDGAASHGWEIGEDIAVFELAPPEHLLDAEQQQSLLYSGDLELGETTARIFEAVERCRPHRVVLDSLSEIRLLAQNSLRYRRQVLAIKHYFSRQNATVLMLDDMTSDPRDKTVHSIAHGVIRLEELAFTYGAERRRMRVMKYRGQAFRGGYHDFTIETGAVRVFPRLVAAEHRSDAAGTPHSSGIAELDGLLGGGVDDGASTLILGPSGTGKTLLGLQFVAAAVEQGQRAAIFVFEEELGLLFSRAAALGIDLRRARDAGRLAVEQVDAAEMPPGQFSHMVRGYVDDHGVRTVLIDSLNGYQAAMPEEQALLLHIHELLQFLSRRGATSFLTVAQHGLVGDMRSPVDITYLADTVVLLRYFEALGHVRRAISVMKKRMGRHERTIREMFIDNSGLRIGEPLHEFQGVLQGVPNFAGPQERLMATHVR